MSDIRSHLEEFAASPEIEMRLRSLFRQIVFVLILLSVWISTKPFSVAPTDGTVPAGDIVNQLTFSSLAILSFICMLWANPRALMPMLQPSYLIMFIWMIVSVINSTYFGVSFRAFAFTTIVIFLSAALFVLPERLRQFQTLFFACCLMTMALSYFGVIALPTLGKHTDFDPFEPEHAGSWKGHFDHKNIAGGAMAAFAIAGVYALRIDRKALGWPLLVGGVMFLYFTNSKTAFALLPVALLLAYMAERMRSLPLRLLICVGPVLALIAITIGSAAVPEIREINKALMKDPSFTGRYDIWRYGFEMLAYKPWLGYGFEAFWQTDTTLKGESRLDLAWAVEKIIHGHNSYLDIALTMGIIGFLIVMYVFVLKPVLDYHRSQRGVEAQPLATMFLATWLFVSLDMCLETYYFRRADPVWFALLVAVLGLRFNAVYPVDQSPSPADQASSEHA
jgi:O-antigen ligase